jgi:hypothetical protein
MGFPNYGTVTLQLRLSYMMSGAPGWKYQPYSLEKAARLSSSWLLGVDVTGA